MTKYRNITTRELLEAFNASETHDFEMCEEMAERAGFAEEFANADSEEFEYVAECAFDILDTYCRPEK